MIQFVKRKDLDVLKYDYCIQNSIQSTIYAYSWYLDIVADNWSVLVLNDYEAVMPVPWKRKFGVKFVAQPPFCQQLGVFSLREVLEKEVLCFWNRIPLYYIKYSYSFNSGNKLKSIGIQKDNYELKLNKSYDELRAGYRKDRKYRLNQVLKRNPTLEKTNIDFLITIAKEYYEFIGLKRKQYLLLKRLAEKAIDLNSGFIYKVLINEKELGGAFFLKDNKRIIYLFSVMLPEGKKMQVPTFILDTIIKEFSNSQLVLDFEGSMIPSIAKFFKSFGGGEEVYVIV